MIIETDPADDYVTPLIVGMTCSSVMTVSVLLLSKKCCKKEKVRAQLNNSYLVDKDEIIPSQTSQVPFGKNLSKEDLLLHLKELNEADQMIVL